MVKAPTTLPTNLHPPPLRGCQQVCTWWPLTEMPRVQKVQILKNSLKFTRFEFWEKVILSYLGFPTLPLCQVSRQSENFEILPTLQANAADNLCWFKPVRNRDQVFWWYHIIPRLVAFLAGDRGMGDCVELPLVVEISLGEYLMFSNEIWPKSWDKSKNQPPVDHLVGDCVDLPQVVGSYYSPNLNSCFLRIGKCWHSQQRWYHWQPGFIEKILICIARLLWRGRVRLSYFCASVVLWLGASHAALAQPLSIHSVFLHRDACSHGGYVVSLLGGSYVVIVLCLCPLLGYWPSFMIMQNDYYSKKSGLPHSNDLVNVGLLWPIQAVPYCIIYSLWGSFWHFSRAVITLDSSGLMVGAHQHLWQMIFKKLY